MDFLNEYKKIELASISKSFAENYDKCKAWAYKKKRNNRDSENKFMLIGKAAHELFAARIAFHLGETYNMQKITDPTVKYEAEDIIKRVWFDKLLSGGEVIGYEAKAEAILSNGMSLVGVFDLVLLVDDPILGRYIHVIDFKTSYVVSKEVDNEVLFYVHLIAKKYGMAVTFTRYSGRTGDEFGKFFTYEDAMALDSTIAPYAEEIKKVIESDEEPFIEPGPQCLQCPFLDECAAKDLDETDPKQLTAKLIVAEAVAKDLKEKVKAMRLENDTEIDTGDYIVDMKESKSNGIATKGVKKNDFVVLLAKNNKLAELLEFVDIKITPEVIAVGKTLGIDFKETTRRNLSIELKEVTNES